MKDKRTLRNYDLAGTRNTGKTIGEYYGEFPNLIAEIDRMHQAVLAKSDIFKEPAEIPCTEMDVSRISTIAELYYNNFKKDLKDWEGSIFWEKVAMGSSAGIASAKKLQPHLFAKEEESPEDAESLQSLHDRLEKLHAGREPFIILSPDVREEKTLECPSVEPDSDTMDRLNNLTKSYREDHSEFLTEVVDSLNSIETNATPECIPTAWGDMSILARAIVSQDVLSNGSSKLKVNFNLRLDDAMGLAREVEACYNDISKGSYVTIQFHTDYSGGLLLHNGGEDILLFTWGEGL